MASIRTICLLLATAIPALALPVVEEGPVLHKRQGDPVPTTIRAAFTIPPIRGHPQQTTTPPAEATSDIPSDGSDEPNPCAAVLCLTNTTCEVVNGEAQCVNIDDTPSPDLPPFPTLTPLPVGEKCGPSVCGPGMVCCNPSCGICTPPDGACIMIFCDFQAA